MGNESSTSETTEPQLRQGGETEKEEEGNFNSLLVLEKDDEVKELEKATKCSEVTAEEPSSVRKEVKQRWGQVVEDIVKKNEIYDESKDQQWLNRDGVKIDNDQFTCFRELQEKGDSLASDELNIDQSGYLEVSKEAHKDISLDPVTEAKNALNALDINGENNSKEAVKSRRKKTIDIEDSEESDLVKKSVVKLEFIHKKPIDMQFTREPCTVGERSRVTVEKAFLVNPQQENISPPVESQQLKISNAQRMTRGQLLKLREINFGLMRER